MSNPVLLQGDPWEMQAGRLPKKSDGGGTPSSVGWNKGRLQSCRGLVCHKLEGFACVQPQNCSHQAFPLLKVPANTKFRFLGERRGLSRVCRWGGDWVLQTAVGKGCPGEEPTISL